MVFSLLADEGAQNNFLSYGLLAVLIVIFVLGFWWSGRQNKKKQKEEEAKLDALKPGNKVTTIGGICGIVVSVNQEDKTFVLETGDETRKSYIKLVRQAVYQTDAEAPKAEAKEEVVVEEKTEEPVAETQE